MLKPSLVAAVLVLGPVIYWLGSSLPDGASLQISDGLSLGIGIALVAAIGYLVLTRRRS